MAAGAGRCRRRRFTFLSYSIPDGAGGYALVSDVDPAYDVCSNRANQVRTLGPNIGELLSAHWISRGGFTGGFGLERRPQWRDTAVIVTWDDSDGWYDHAFATPTNSS